MKKLVLLVFLAGCVSSGKFENNPPQCHPASDPFVGTMAEQPADLPDLVRRRQELERQGRCRRSGSNTEQFDLRSSDVSGSARLINGPRA